MKRTTERRRLAIRRETLRRLANGDLGQVAGGRYNQWCTYAASGCQGEPSSGYGCVPENPETRDCDSNCCL